MAVKLISIFAVLALAAFLYKSWDSTAVPEDIPADEAWKVKTIEFTCRPFNSLHWIATYLGFQPQPMTRIIMSYLFAMQRLQREDSTRVTVHEKKMSEVPVLHFEYNNQKVESSGPQAIIIYIHGGGWELLDAQAPEAVLYMLTEKLQIPAISVDYRLSPEHPYPAGLDDCLKVANYVIDHHKELAVDPSKIIVAGDSAGGNLAAAVALKLKKKIRLQVLVYPVLQAFDLQTTSYREHASTVKSLLNLEKMAAFISNYGGFPPSALDLVTKNKHISEATRKSRYSGYVHSDLIKHMNVTKLTSIHHSSMSYSLKSELVEEIEQRVLDPYFAPLMADSLDDVTDAYVITAHHDVLRDDGLLYCSRLNAAHNVVCHSNNYVQGFHGFFYFVDGPLQLTSAKQAVGDLVDYIKTNIL